MPTQKKNQTDTQNTGVLTPLLDTKGKLNRLLGKTAQPESDFTDLERAQSGLRDSEVRYRRLFETAKDGILILDGDTGRISDANPFLQDMLGYPKAELIGKALWEIGPVKDIAASQEAMRHLQDSDYIRYENLPLQTKSGEQKQVEFVSNVYLVEGWRVIQCNIRVITLRKQAEDRAQAASEALLALVDDLQERDRQMQLLNHMNDLLQSCVTQDEAYRVITLSAGELFPGQNGCLAVLHPGDPHLSVVARWGSEVVIEPTFLLEDCWALRRGQLHEVANPQTDLVCRHFVHAPQAGYLCLPLTVQGDTLGLLCLAESAAHKGRPHPGQQQLVVAIGETIKLALSNLKLREELRQQIIHDPLTGLYNRGYMEEVLERELLRATRKKLSLGIIMLDVDDFKRFNDTLGHAAGDAILRELGAFLLGHVRGEDINCRYGGEEFIIILPDASLAVTSARAELIRQSVTQIYLPFEGKVLESLTLSLGVAVFPENGSSSSAVLRAADSALYRAKLEGRGRVAVAQ